MESGCDGEVVFQFVSCPFLFITCKSAIDFESPELTFSLLAVCGSMTLRRSRTSWASECPTWPCLRTNDFGFPSLPCSSAGAFLCVLFFRRRAMVSRVKTKSGRGNKILTLFFTRCNVEATWSARETKRCDGDGIVHLIASAVQEINK